MAEDEGGQPHSHLHPRVALLLEQLATIDDRAYNVPRMVFSVLLFERAGWLTGIATRSAFSGTANTRGALEDRIHNWIGYCDQAGESATADMVCPTFWQPITDALPDKLALFNILSGLTLYSLAAFNQREPRVFCKLITEHFVLYSTLLTLRAAVVASTIVPAPSPLCRNATHWPLGPGGRPTRGWFLSTVDYNDAVRSNRLPSVLLGLGAEALSPFTDVQRSHVPLLAGLRDVGAKLHAETSQGSVGLFFRPLLHRVRGNARSLQ